MVKRGLPGSVKMRHDSHYVDELAKESKTVGKVLPINQLEPNPEQPRVEFGDLEELTSSIKQNGVLEPILVKPIENSNRYLIIAGERRWRASNKAGLTEVPCIELDIDEQTISEIALIENLQRKDLTIWEISDGLADLAERFGYTHDDIAKKIGKSRSTVTESMAIAGLPESIRQRCREANIRAKSTLVEISRQFDESEMHSFLDDLLNKEISEKRVKKKTKKKISEDNKETVSAQDNDLKKKHKKKKSFIYKGGQNNFELKIDFEDDSITNNDVLRALKEAFDSVKNNS